MHRTCNQLSYTIPRTAAGLFFKMKSMRKILFASMFFIAAMIFGTMINAQNFPATEKEVTEILCATKWKADTVMMGEKKIAAVDMFGDVSLGFKADGNYTITLMNRDKKGTWKTDMATKTVDIFEKGEKETVIKDIVATRIVFSEADPESADEAMTIIFKASK